VREMERSKALGIGLAVVFSAALVAPLGAAAADVDMYDGQWHYQATIYVWLPTMWSTFRLPGSGNLVTIETKPHDYLSDLKFGFMGAGEARKGEWSILTDIVYADIGSQNGQVRHITGPGGDISLPIDTSVSAGVRSTIWTLVGGYTVLRTPSLSLDVIAGARYGDLKATASWSATGPLGAITLNGGASTRFSPWDAIIGVKGAVGLADENRLFMPYEADIGWGHNQRVWNGIIGLGYRFGWGDLLVAYRNLQYTPNGEPTFDRFRMGGIAFGATFRW
jgi:hypothetical protein